MEKKEKKPPAASHRGFVVLKWHGVFTFCYPWLDLNDVWVSHVLLWSPTAALLSLTLSASTCTCAYVCACTSLSLQPGKPARLRHRQRKAQPWPVYQSLIALQLRTDCTRKQGGSLWVSVHLNTPHIFCKPLTPTGPTSINNKTQSRQLNYWSVLRARSSAGTSNMRGRREMCWWLPAAPRRSACHCV